MARALTIKNVMSKKFKTYPLKGIYKKVLGTPSIGGVWIIYGKEKNGKTWAALLVSAMLSEYERVLYISAEEGLNYEFQQSISRAKLDHKNNRLHFHEYEPVDELRARLEKPKAPKIVVLDNATIYHDELGRKGLIQLVKDFPNVDFIVVAHEERNQPYTATGQTAKKLAKVIMHVQGLAILVSGRVPGGVLMIDENQAVLYHGEQIKNQ